MELWQIELLYLFLVPKGWLCCLWMMHKWQFYIMNIALTLGIRESQGWKETWYSLSGLLHMQTLFYICIRSLLTHPSSLDSSPYTSLLRWNLPTHEQIFTSCFYFYPQYLFHTRAHHISGNNLPVSPDFIFAGLRFSSSSSVVLWGTCFFREDVGPGSGHALHRWPPV